MTDEEYLKRYYQELNSVDENDSEKDEDFIDTAKGYLKHIAAGAAGAIPASYLLNGGKSIGPSIVAGGISAALKHALSDSDNIGSSIFTGVGVGALVGAKNLTDSLSRENSSLKEQAKGNMDKNNKKENINSSCKNFSEIKDFFSSYSEEGLKNFSEKLHNFMMLSEIGGFNAMKDAPEGEKIRYAALGSATGLAGGVTGGLLGSVSGIGSGFMAGLASGTGIKNRIARATTGAIAGGTALGTAGGVLGSKLGSDQGVKILKEQKINKIMKKAALNKYLTEEEKALLKKYLYKKNRKEALEYAESLMDEENLSFSENENFASIWDIGKAFYRGVNKGSAAFNKKAAKSVEDWLGDAHPGVAKTIKYGGGIGATATATTAANATPMLIPGGKDWLLGQNKDTSVLPIIPGGGDAPVLNPTTISSVGGAGIGAIINNKNPLVGAVSGAVGGLAGSVLAGSMNVNDNLGKSAIGLGTGALASYLTSKLTDKNKDKEKPFYSLKKKKVGRPSKRDLDDEYPFLQEEVS